MSKVSQYLHSCIDKVAAEMPMIDKFDIIADAGLEHEIDAYMAPLRLPSLVPPGWEAMLPILAPISRERAISFAFHDALMSGVIPDRIYWPAIFQTLGRDDARFLLQLPETGPIKELMS